MESKRKIEIGITIGLLIIAAAFIGTMNQYITFGDTSGPELNITDDNDGDESILVLKGIVVIDNQIPNLTIAVIFENKGELPLDINGSWDLTTVDTDETLDSGTDTFTIQEESNFTNTISPTTDYIGTVIISYSGNGQYASELFETRPVPGTTFTGGSDGGGGSEEKGCYDGFTEYDPEGNITLTDDRITFYRMHRDYEGAVYKNYGSGYFGQTFTHTFQFMITSGNESFEGTFMPWSLCNEISTFHDFMYGDDCIEDSSDDHDGLSLTIQPRAEPDAEHPNGTGTRGFVRDWTIGTNFQYFLPLEDVYNKTIYTTVTRDNGFLVVVFYRDSARTDIITSASVETGTESYRILQAFGARGSKQCAPWWSPLAFVSGYIENLNLGS